MAYTYLVPSDTARILTTHAENCQNLALILARYIPHEAIRNDDVLNDRGRAVDKVRSKWLTNILKDFTGANVEAIIFANLDRWSATVKAGNASTFQMRLRGRMVVGLGGKNPMEFGITLNRLTGLPYIPGSALKGLARSYALLTLAGEFGIPIETEPLEKFDAALSKGTHDNNLLAKHYHLAFGTQADAGGCVFYDAVVSNVANPNESLFVMDVMTPHFVKYYTSGGTDAPHDGDSPNPVSYVAVREGVSFGFAVGSRTGFVDVDNATRKQARNWLRSALEEMGIGAKTAQGYGVFAKPD